MHHAIGAGLILLFSFVIQMKLQAQGSPTIVNLTLVNADDDTDIGILNDGDTLILNLLPSSDLNIRANTNPTTVDKVTFDLDGVLDYRQEGIAPYALMGDKNGDYNEWTPSPGAHVVSATPKLGGSTGPTHTVNFFVIASVPIDCNGDINGTAYLDDCGICVGGNTGLAPNLDKDTCGVCFGDGTSCVGGCAGPTVSSFTLINTSNGSDLGFVEDGDTIDETQLFNFTLRADVCGTSTESVKFLVDGNYFNLDNGDPYALNGNSNGFYNSWNADSGMHMITAIPYSQNNGSGTAGAPYSINILVIDTGYIDTTGYGNTPNEVCGMFTGGRIALSFDGNLHDSDDYASLPMAMAMIYFAGHQDSLVHVEYNNHLGYTDSVQEYEMGLSAREAVKRWGYSSDIMYDAVNYPDSTSDALAAAINASSEGSPLWIMAGGPMETIARGLAKADSTKRQFVRVVSHSNWNENHTHFGPPLYNDWSDLIATYTDDSTQFIEVPDMNGDVNHDRFKGPRSKWRWLINDPDTNFHWLYARNKTAAFDVSDAGMTYWLLSGGDTMAGTDETRGLLENLCDYSCSCPCDTNQLAAMNMSAPNDSDNFALGASVLLETTVNNPDSNTVYVQFFTADSILGVDSTNTYQWNVTGLDTGYHEIYTRSIDSCGETAYSDTITIRIQLTDCAGVVAGSAYLDDCGICVGGTTGLVPNLDKDTCGVCFGDNLSCISIDCNNDTTGTAFVDSCGICSGGNTGLVPNASCTDCNGEVNGTAAVDSCGVCSGGSTGLIPNSSCADCNGDPNGTAYIDSCGVCAEGNTGIVADQSCIDCDSVVNGTASVDSCGVCSGGTTGITPNSSCADCSGTPNGTAFVDTCGVCSGGTTGIIPGSTCSDCNGDLFGSAYIDSCGVCAEGNTGVVANVSCTDCNGVVNGTASIDACGTCSGGNTGITPDSACTDCAGTVNGSAAVDSCGVCAGGTTGIIPGVTCGCINLEVVSFTLMTAGSGGGPVRKLVNNDIIYRSNVGQFSIRADICNDTIVGSVIFKLDGSDIRTENIAPYAINGDNANGFKAWNIANGTYSLMATPYSNPNGNGTMGVSEIISFSIEDNAPLVDCNGDTSGTANVDQCGVCAGGNTGIVPNASCTDCNAVVNGSASVDSCGVCAGGNTGNVPNQSCTDCNGDLNGLAYIDSCGLCAGGATGITPNASCLDCAGVPNGTAVVDSCGDCVLGTTGLGFNSGCNVDCNGDVDGLAYLDSCGICAGGSTGVLPDSSCTDCNGVVNGSASIDACGVCSGGNTGNVPNQTCTDCNGVVNGTAAIDTCGVCAGGNTGIVPDLSCVNCLPNEVVSFTLMQAGAGGGPIRKLVNGDIVYKASVGLFSIRADICNDSLVGSVLFNLNGNNIRTESVAPYAINGDKSGEFTSWDPAPGSYVLVGTPFTGPGTTGTMGISETLNFTVAIDPPAIDCNGDSAGTAIVDDCGICAGGNTGITPNVSCTDCNGDVNGTAVIDSCGICSGGNTGIVFNSACYDCAGVAYGSAFIDACGDCVGGTTGHQANASCTDCNGDVNGSAIVDSCGICSGGNTGNIINATCADCNGDPYGSADIDTCGVCSGGNTGIAPNSTCGGPCDPNEVTMITLLNATNGADLGELADGDTINLTVLPQFSARAEVCSDPAVESVVFNLNGGNIRTENVAPYSVNGDNNGSYTAWPLSPGMYMLMATPFSGNNSSGTQGVSKIVTFYVVNGPTPTDCNGDVGGSAYIDGCGFCVGGNTGASPCATSAGCDEFIETSGLVVVELESEPKANSQWYEGSGAVSGLSIPNPSGTYYMWQQNCISGSAPNYNYSGCGGTTSGNNNNAMTYEIYFSTTGRYRFQMKSWQPSIQYGSHGAGTENNDFWIQLPDGGGIRKKGGTEDPIGTSEWVKIYQNNPGDWRWISNTVDGNPHQIYIDILAPGAYTVKIGARSKLMALDRFVLYRSDNASNNVSESYATSDSRSESARGSCGARVYNGPSQDLNGSDLTSTDGSSGNANTLEIIGLSQEESFSLNAYPNPTTGALHLDILPANSRAEIELYDAAGKLLLRERQNGEHNSIDLTSYAPGIYWIKLNILGEIKLRRVYKQ